MGDSSKSPNRGQRRRLLAYLKAGNKIGVREAERLFSIGRLAARIHELRAEGYPIENRRKRIINGEGKPTSVSEYSLRR